MKIPINRIVVSKDNPRQSFDEAKLLELGESIKDRDLIQPIIVRPKGDFYELVVGERRLKASKLVGLSTIEAIIRDLDDRQCDFYRLIENTQREDLTEAEKGNAVAHMVEAYPEYTIGDVAKELKKSEVTIYKWLQQSAKLSDFVKKSIQLYKLSTLVVRALVKFPHEEQNKLAEAIIKYKITPGSGAEKHMEFVDCYQLNPEKYPTVESLEDLANEVKGIKKVKIDLAKLSDEARQEVERKIKEAKDAEKEAKARMKKQRKPRVNTRRQGRPLKKAKPQPEQPTEEKKPIPEPTIPTNTNIVTIALNFPEPLWEKIHRYIAQQNQPLLLDEAVISLLETHPALKEL